MFSILSAARRRLVKRIYVGLPSKETRRQIISNLLNDQNHNISSRSLSSIVNGTEGNADVNNSEIDTHTGYSAFDLTALCKDAALGPIRELGSSIKDVPESEVRPIILKDFQHSLTQIRPSVSSESVKLYEKWNQEFGSLSL